MDGVNMNTHYSRQTWLHNECVVECWITGSILTTVFSLVRWILFTWHLNGNERPLSNFSIHGLIIIDSQVSERNTFWKFTQNWSPNFHSSQEPRIFFISTIFIIHFLVKWNKKQPYGIGRKWSKYLHVLTIKWNKRIGPFHLCVCPFSLNTLSTVYKFSIHRRWNSFNLAHSIGKIWPKYNHHCRH